MLLRRASVLSALGVVVVAVVACVGDDPAVTSATSANDAGTTTTTPPADSGSTPAGPTCRSDQLLCDGACVDIGPTHCGSCTTVCPTSAPLCASGAGGAPACVSNCGSGQTACGELCVDTTTNPSNCGGCGNKCTTPSNGVATCANSTCDFSCKTNFHPCGSSCAADDDVMNCGATCKVCPVPTNGTATCNGSCGFTCSGALTACTTQGVCANLTNDVNNCGACGKACTIASSCSSSICPVTFGYPSMYGENGVLGSTEFGAIKVTTPKSITVTGLGMIVIGYTSQYNVWLALYGDSGGAPGARLAQVNTVVTGNGTVVLSLASPVTIAAGTYYIGSTQSSFHHFGFSSSGSAGQYWWAKNVTGSTYSASAAPSPAPTTTALTGGMNYWLVGKE